MTLAIALLAALATGCGTTETVFVRPDCRPAERPVIPPLDRGEVWDALRAGAKTPERGEDLYHGIALMENRLTDWGLENEAVLKQVCSPRFRPSLDDQSQAPE